MVRGLLLRRGGADPVRRARLDRPARLQGLRARPARPRQADGGPPPAGRLLLALVRVARHGHVRRRDARPAVARRAPATRWRRRGRRWPSPSSSSRSSASRTTASTTATSRPRARRFAEFRSNLDALVDDAAGLPGADRRPAPVGHGQPVHPPALPGRRRDQPGSRGLRLRRGPGQAHARGHQAARRRELRPVGRPRGLRHAPQHRPPPRGRPARPLPAPRRRAQAQDRVQGPAAHRAQADGADQAPVRLRHRDRPRLPRQPRPRGRVPGQHRGEPRDARRPQLPPRGRLRDRQRDARQHRRQPRRPAERLGHRPVPELGRGPGAAALRDPAHGGIAPGGFNFDAKLRRQSIDRNDLFHAHIGGIDTLARALLVAADLVERGELAGAQGRALRRLGRRARHGDPGRRGDRSSRSRPGSPPARSTRGRCPVDQERLENVVNRSIWATDRPGRRPAPAADTDGATSSGSTSRPPRPRPS